MKNGDGERKMLLCLRYIVIRSDVLSLARITTLRSYLVDNKLTHTVHNITSNRYLSFIYKIHMDKFVNKTPRSPKSKTKTEKIVDGICNKHEDKTPLVQEQPNRHITRDIIKKQEISDRVYYLNMPISDRRKLYKCGSKYVTIDDLTSWPDYYNKNYKELTGKIKGKPRKVMADANEELNEKITLWKGDITRLEIDAIANAANSSLLGGGGVDGAIHHAAGPKLKKECVTLEGCKTGDAKITAGYNLPAKYIIHTVGPIGEQQKALQSCYERCLKVMKENKLKSIAFPCISTGIYGYPNERATPVGVGTIRKWLEEDDYANQVKRIIFCVFLPVDLALYQEHLQAYFPASKIHETSEILSSQTDEVSSVEEENKKTQDQEFEKQESEGEENQSPRAKKKPPPVPDISESKDLKNSDTKDVTTCENETDIVNDEKSDKANHQ